MHGFVNRCIEETNVKTEMRSTNNKYVCSYEE